MTATTSERAERSGAVRWLHVLRMPLLLAGACVIGAVLQLGLGLPGTPVWLAVLVAEAAIVLLDRRGLPARRRAAKPRPAAPDPEAEPRAPELVPAPRPQPAPEPEPVAAPRPQPAPEPALPPVAAPRPQPVPAAAPRPVGEGPALGPPSAGRWTAEISWRGVDNGARFEVVASDGEDAHVLARSPDFAWPIADPEAIHAVRDAAGALEDALLRGGWGPLPSGEGWYAKRFTWPPDAEAAEVAPAPHAPPAAAPAPPAGPRAWPAETRDLPRCEIRWSSGYRTSRFKAVRLGAGPRKPILAESEPFKWMLASEPDHEAADQVSAIDRLSQALIAAGWEEIGVGPSWYARRFVWKRDAPVPDELPTPRT